LALIGWILFFFLFRTESKIDPDAAAERGGIDAAPKPFENHDDSNDPDP
jgi:hypothetical protein